MFFNKKKKIDNSGAEDRKVEIVAGMPDEQPKEESTEQPKIEEEWIWIEGYKGTDKDIKCRGDYQYELNYLHIHTDEVELCEKGFHFCTRLGDVFEYYDLNKINRFFKVKGLVKKKDYENIDSCKMDSRGYVTRDSKLSAKEIIFLEELKFNDLKPHIKYKLIFVETEDEYYNGESYNEFCENKFLSEMNRLGFSELYSYMKYTSLNHYEDLYIFLQKVRAYQAEGVSKDIVVYLLETVK